MSNPTGGYFLLLDFFFWYHARKFQYCQFRFVSRPLELGFHDERVYSSVLCL